LSRLASVTAEVDALFEEFEFAKACDVLYHFAWDEFCDWYLELAKAALTGAGTAAPDGAAAVPAGPGAAPDGAAAVPDGTRRVLGYVLDRLLRLIHPVMPFVTDELWTALTGGESVMVAPWPGELAPGTLVAGALAPGALAPGAAVGPDHADPHAEAVIESLMRLVTGIRRFRADQGLRPSQAVPAVLTGLESTPLAAHEHPIRSLLRLTVPAVGFTPNASVQAEGVTVQLDTSSGIDVAAERRRMTKDLAAAHVDAEVAERKLSTESFVDRAPAEVVAKTRDRLAVAHAEIARITQRLAELADSSS